MGFSPLFFPVGLLDYYNWISSCCLRLHSSDPYMTLHSFCSTLLYAFYSLSFGSLQTWSWLNFHPRNIWQNKTWCIHKGYKDVWMCLGLHHRKCPCLKLDKCFDVVTEKVLWPLEMLLRPTQGSREHNLRIMELSRTILGIIWLNKGNFFLFSLLGYGASIWGGV